MAISTYSGLKTAVSAWLNRTDLAAYIPDFIALAESDIRNDVRVRAMQVLTTGTLTGETLDAPARFLEAQRLFVSDKKKEYRTPEQYQDARVASGQTDVFTHIGESLYILNGGSGDAYSLLYWQSFADLSEDDDTNWLLTNAPDVYLWAACRQAAIYLKSDGEIAKMEGLYAASVARVNAREKRAGASGSVLVQFAAKVA